jgi:hypothetical protein
VDLIQAITVSACRQSRHFKELAAKVVKTFELRVKKRRFPDVSANVVIAKSLRLNSSKHVGCGCRDAGGGAARLVRGGESFPTPSTNLIPLL